MERFFVFLPNNRDVAKKPDFPMRNTLLLKITISHKKTRILGHISLAFDFLLKHSEKICARHVGC